MKDRPDAAATSQARQKPVSWGLLGYAGSPVPFLHIFAVYLPLPRRFARNLCPLPHLRARLIATLNQEAEDEEQDAEVVADIGYGCGLAHGPGRDSPGRRRDLAGRIAGLRDAD